MKKRGFLFLAVITMLVVSSNTAIWAQEGPSTADEFISYGTWLADEKKDYDAAIVAFTEAIGLDRNNAGAYYSRGNAYLNKKDYDRATADFEAALKINANYAEAKRGLEIAQQQQRMQIEMQIEPRRGTKQSPRGGVGNDPTATRGDRNLY
jgi:tetratricopeptide (TPR) repeat protein